MSKKRQDLVETAIELFAQYGFHGTGIDRIAEVAGVSKKTLYHHFRSKDELILAALKYHDGLFRNFLMKTVNQLSSSPYERLLGIFDVAHDWFCENNFYGCMFINAVGEYSDKDSAVRRACQDYKNEVKAYIRELCTAADVNDPQAMADAISLLLEGAIVTAQVSGDPSSAKAARAAAQALLDSALSE